MTADANERNKAVRQQLTQPGPFGESLWLVWPDHWPDGLSVVWLVLGVTPDHMQSVTIPVGREAIPALVKALGSLPGGPTP